MPVKQAEKYQDQNQMGIKFKEVINYQWQAVLIYSLSYQESAPVLVFHTILCIFLRTINCAVASGVRKIPMNPPADICKQPIILMWTNTNVFLPVKIRALPIHTRCLWKIWQFFFVLKYKTHCAILKLKKRETIYKLRTWSWNIEERGEKTEYLYLHLGYGKSLRKTWHYLTMLVDPTILSAPEIPYAIEDVVLVSWLTCESQSSIRVTSNSHDHPYDHPYTIYSYIFHKSQHSCQC